MTLQQEIRLFSGAARENPYPYYSILRDASPVYKEPEFGTFVLTRFDDVYGALKDHTTYSSALGISPGLQGSTNPLMTSMITTDPPRHTRLRALVNRAFTPKVLSSLEPWLVELVDERIDAFSLGEDVEIVQNLTVPLPVMAIARVMGIPPGDRDKFKEWSDAVVGATDRAIPDDEREKIREMMRYFAATIADRKASPGEDLMSTIALAEVEGERLTDIEMLGFCLLLLIAGNETTTNLLSNLLHMLSGRPDLWAKLRDNPDRIPAAVEEALRYDSPVQMLFRTTTREVVMHGQTIPAGARVAVSYAAANRDGREFPEPDTFRLDRRLGQHIAFGYGIHYCLGAPLARLETRVAIERLTSRFASIAPGEGLPRRVPSAILRGFEVLPLRFEK